MMMMMEALQSTKTSVLTRATWRNIREDSILHRLKVFDNGVLRRIFGPRRYEVTGVEESLIRRRFMTYTLCQV
jgi:hypothetical protein